MGPSRLDAIRARLAAATPGPWDWEGARPDPDGGPPFVPQGSHAGDTGIALDYDGENYREDCELVRHAPADLAALLRVAEAACAYAHAMGERHGDELFAAVRALEAGEAVNSSVAGDGGCGDG